jgi:hypothetical protein
MKPGPKHDRFDDTPYMYRMAQLIDAEGIKAWPAAQRVVDDALPGNSDYAKSRRIHKKFMDRFGNLPVGKTLAVLLLWQSTRPLATAAQDALRRLDASDEMKRLRRSGIENLWDDEEFWKYVDLDRNKGMPLDRVVENYLHPARERRNYLQRRDRANN